MTPPPHVPRTKALASRAGGILNSVPGMSQTAFGNYALVIGQTIRTLLLARLLGPSTFGVLSLANVAANFTSFADLGTSVVADQKASAARGRGDELALRSALRDSLGARLTSALVLGTLLGLVSLVLIGLRLHDAALVLAFLACSAPAQSAWFACRGYLRVMGEFTLASNAQLVQAGLWLTVVPLAAWLGGLYAALAAIVLSFIPPVLLCLKVVPWRWLLTPRPRAFIRFTPAGLPLWLALVSSFLFIYTDQFLVGSLLGSAAIGIYAIASVTSAVLMAFSDGAAAAAHPQTLEAHERDGGLTVGTPSVWRTIRTSQLILGTLTPLSWFGLALLVGFFLPDYAPSLDVVVLLGPAAVAIAMTTAANSSLLAVGRHRKVPVFYFVALGVKVICALILVAWRPTLTTFAIATFIAALAFLLLYYAELTRALGLRSGAARRWVAFHATTPVFLAGLGTVVMLLGATEPVRVAILSLSAALVSTGLHLLLFKRYPSSLQSPA